MTGKSQIQRKLQQPQLSDSPDRRMGHAQRIQHPQDQRRPPHRQCRRLDLRLRLILIHLLQPTRLLIIPVGSTMLSDAKRVFSLQHQYTTAKHSLPYVRTVASSIQSLQMPANPTAEYQYAGRRWPTRETTCPSPTRHRVFHRRRPQVTHSRRKSHWPGRAMHPDRWDRTTNSSCPGLH